VLVSPGTFPTSNCGASSLGARISRFAVVACCVDSPGSASQRLKVSIRSARASVAKRVLVRKSLRDEPGFVLLMIERDYDVIESKSQIGRLKLVPTWTG